MTAKKKSTSSWPSPDARRMWAARLRNATAPPRGLPDWPGLQGARSPTVFRSVRAPVPGLSGPGGRRVSAMGPNLACATPWRRPTAVYRFEFRPATHGAARVAGRACTSTRFRKPGAAAHSVAKVDSGGAERGSARGSAHRAVSPADTLWRAPPSGPSPGAVRAARPRRSERVAPRSAGEPASRYPRPSRVAANASQSASQTRGRGGYPS